MKYKDELYYHIYNRGARSCETFFSDENYNYFLRLISKNSQLYNVVVAAYCLMPNHYHLTVMQQTRGSISKFLQSTMTSFVQAMNKMYDLSGSLFQGKAKAKLIDSDEYVLQVIRYVHLNPVKARLVHAPEDWLFSDYREWIDGTSPTAFSDWRGTLRDVYFANAKDYQQFVEEYQIEQRNNKLEKFLFKED